MAIQKLSSTDAFVVVDFPDAPASGIVRRARKILESGAIDLARSASYTFGVFGVERSGASAGINAEGDAVGPAIEAVLAELGPRFESGQLRLIAGKGVDPKQLAPQADSVGPAAPGDDGAVDGASSGEDRAVAGDDDLLVAGVLAAARWAAGGSLDGVSVAIEAPGEAPGPLAAALREAGARVVDVWGVAQKPWLVWGADVDLVLAGSRPGALGHQGAGMVSARAIVPWGPLPVTTKAFAQLRRTGRVQVVPDFIAIAGPLLAGVLDPGGDPAPDPFGGDPSGLTSTVAARITDVLDECAGHPDGLLLGACYRAEAFFQEWRGEKPFGRPLAA